MRAYCACREAIRTAYPASCPLCDEPMCLACSVRNEVGLCRICELKQESAEAQRRADAELWAELSRQEVEEPAPTKVRCTYGSETPCGDVCDYACVHCGVGVCGKHRNLHETWCRRLKPAPGACKKCWSPWFPGRPEGLCVADGCNAHYCVYCNLDQCSTCPNFCCQRHRKLKRCSICLKSYPMELKRRVRLRGGVALWTCQCCAARVTVLADCLLKQGFPVVLVNHMVERLFARVALDDAHGSGLAGFAASWD